MALALGLSVLCHGALVVWASQSAWSHRVEPKAKPVQPVAVRSVYQDVVLPRPSPPPAPPAQVVEAVAPKPTLKPAQKPQRQPAKKRRQRRRKTAQKTMAPKPSAPVVVQAASHGVATVDAQEDVADPLPPAAAQVVAAVEVKSQEPPQVDLSGYGVHVRTAVQRRQRYPEIAEEQGLEGRVVVVVRVTQDGQLAAPPKVEKSSGHRCLDHEAVRMVKRAAPFRRLPEGYRGDVATLRIPVVFHLDEDDF